MQLADIELLSMLPPRMKQNEPTSNFNVRYPMLACPEFIDSVVFVNEFGMLATHLR